MDKLAPLMDSKSLENIPLGLNTWKDSTSIKLKYFNKLENSIKSV